MKDRESEIEANNMILLDKIYGILTAGSKNGPGRVKKSLNYSKRKKEIGRINEENRDIYKSIVHVKPSVNLKKIKAWNRDMEKYKRNISTSARRSNPYRPILTQGIIDMYPEIRSKTCVGSTRAKNLTTGLPSVEHFTNLLNSEFEEFTKSN
jgi:hypothetical protein